jgi:CRP/FNR family cyclic AMP-dependent transcriptional regulator
MSRVSPSVSDWIDRLPLFAGLSQTTRNDLAQASIVRNWPAREIIVHMGDVWPYLFVVMDGEIGAIKESAKGRELTVTTLSAGDVFWGLAFVIEERPMPVLFQAQTDSTLCMWDRERLVPIIQRNGKMSWMLCQLMVSRMQLASEIVEELAFQPVMNRLSNLILEMFGDDSKGSIERELTLDEMASRIGTTREMVCRHLYRLAEWGAIDVSRTQLRIENRALLEKKAGGS